MIYDLVLKLHGPSAMIRKFDSGYPIAFPLLSSSRILDDASALPALLLFDIYVKTRAQTRQKIPCRCFGFSLRPMNKRFKPASEQT